jgi:hypothetical protein
MIAVFMLKIKFEGIICYPAFYFGFSSNSRLRNIPENMV